MQTEAQKAKNRGQRPRANGVGFLGKGSKHQVRALGNTGSSPVRSRAGRRPQTHFGH